MAVAGVLILPGGSIPAGCDPKNADGINECANVNGEGRQEAAQQAGDIGELAQREGDNNEPAQQEVNNEEAADQQGVAGQAVNHDEPRESINKREILKSILYGGLTELITSLGIVTSAASTGATTGKIVALSLTNLITGLFVMTYKIAEKHRTTPSEGNETEQEVDEYKELFGDRQNHRLHLAAAMISFLIFGLVPPLVYAFTFRNPEDKFLKIPAVAIVSILFIGLLGGVKAYIVMPENCLEYVYIIGTCIFDAIGTSTLTTFGGELIENYVEKAGWFDFGVNKVPTLFLPGMSFKNHT